MSNGNRSPKSNLLLKAEGQEKPDQKYLAAEGGVPVNVSGLITTIEDHAVNLLIRLRQLDSLVTGNDLPVAQTASPDSVGLLGKLNDLADVISHLEAVTCRLEVGLGQEVKLLGSGKVYPR